MAVRISTAFNIAFPIGGFLASFPVSKLLQRTDQNEHVYWGAVWAVSNLFSLLSLVPYIPAQVSTW